MNGLVHVYCGDGKGKTTAAMGLALRALGQGKRVVVLQFLKSTPSGEVPLLGRLGAVVLRGKSSEKFVWQMDEEGKSQTRTMQTEHLREAIALVNAGKCDLLVLDEAAAAVELGMADEALLHGLVTGKPPELELVLTGRNPAGFMLAAADYITEMKKLRHPYDRGVAAREGIEF